MALVSGNRATADRVNNLQTKIYYAIGSGTIAASQTNAAVTSATVTFETLTDNATYAAFCIWDYNAAGLPAATSTARMVADGVNQSPLATFNATGGTERGTVAQNYSDTLPTAGNHTLHLIATTSTNTTVLGVNCSILVIVEEVA